MAKARGGYEPLKLSPGWKSWCHCEEAPLGLLGTCVSGACGFKIQHSGFPCIDAALCLTRDHKAALRSPTDRKLSPGAQNTGPPSWGEAVKAKDVPQITYHRRLYLPGLPLLSAQSFTTPSVVARGRASHGSKRASNPDRLRPPHGSRDPFCPRPRSPARGSASASRAGWRARGSGAPAHPPPAPLRLGEEARAQESAGERRRAQESAGERGAPRCRKRPSTPETESGAWGEGAHELPAVWHDLLAQLEAVLWKALAPQGLRGGEKARGKLGAARTKRSWNFIVSS